MLLTATEDGDHAPAAGRGEHWAGQSRPGGGVLIRRGVHQRGRRSGACLLLLSHGQRPSKPLLLGRSAAKNNEISSCRHNAIKASDAAINNWNPPRAFQINLLNAPTCLLLLLQPGPWLQRASRRRWGRHRAVGALVVASTGAGSHHEFITYFIEHKSWDIII